MATQRQLPQRDKAEPRQEADGAQKPLVMYKSIVEYEKKIAQLSQDNFDLRLYCYNLEEKVKQMGLKNADDSNAHRDVSHLESEIRDLRDSVERKAALLLQGSTALDQLRLELEAALQENRQLCCGIRQQDCQIDQLASDNAALCAAACQLEQQVCCLEQRCLASEARILELDELARRRNCELTDVRARLRECGECLHQLMLAEDQRQAAESEARQSEVSKIEVELSRLRAENADLRARLDTIPQLQRDIKLLERVDRELRAVLQAERRKSEELRLQYEKPPQRTSDAEADSGQGSQGPVSLGLDTARKWRGENITLSKDGAVESDSEQSASSLVEIQLQSEVAPTALMQRSATTDAKIKLYSDQLASNPPIDELLKILMNLKQALAEQRKAIETGTESNMAYDGIIQLIEKLIGCMRRVQVALKMAAENGNGEIGTAERVMLEALSDLLNLLLEELNKQMRLLAGRLNRSGDIQGQVPDEGKATSSNDRNGLLTSIETFFAELEKTIGEILVSMAELERVNETKGTHEMWKNVAEKYSSQNDWLRKLLHSLGNLLEEHRATGFELPGLLETKANNLANKLSEIRERYDVLARNSGMEIQIDSKRSSSGDVQKAVENLVKFRRLVLHSDSVQSPAQLAFFTQLSHHINTVNAAFSQSNRDSLHVDLSRRISHVTNLLDRYAELQNFLRRKMMLLRQAIGHAEKEAIKDRQEMLVEAFETLLLQAEQFCSTGRTIIQTIPFESTPKTQSIMARISWLLEEAHVNNQMFEALFIDEKAGDTAMKLRAVRLGPESTGQPSLHSADLLSPSRRAEESTRQDLTILQSSIEATPENCKVQGSQEFGEVEELMPEDTNIRRCLQLKKPITTVSNAAAPASALPASQTVDSLTCEYESSPCAAELGSGLSARNTNGTQVSRDPMPIEQRHFGPSAQKGKLELERSDSAPTEESKNLQPPPRHRSLQTDSATKSASKSWTTLSNPTIEFDVNVDGESSEATQSTDGKKRFESPKSILRARSPPTDFARKIGKKLEKVPRKPKIKFDIDVDVESTGESASAWSTKSSRKQATSRGSDDQYTASSLGTTVSAVDEFSERSHLSDKPAVQLMCTVLDTSRSEKSAVKSPPTNLSVMHLSCKEISIPASSKGSNEVTLLCTPLSEINGAKDSFSDHCSENNLAVRSELRALLKNLSVLRGNCTSGGSHEFSGRDIASLTSKIRQVLGEGTLDQPAGTEYTGLRTENNSVKNHNSISSTKRSSNQWSSKEASQNGAMPFSLTLSDDHNTRNCTPFHNVNTNRAGGTMSTAAIGQLTSEHHNVEYFLGPEEQAGGASCRQDGERIIMVQAAIVQPPQLHSARSNSEANLLSMPQATQSMLPVQNLGSVDANLQRAVWLLRTINKESAEVLEPLYGEDYAPMQAEELVEMLQQVSNRLEYLLSSLNQIGESLPSLAFDCNNKAIRECEGLLRDLLNSHTTHFETMKAKLQRLRQNRALANWPQVEATIREGNEIISKLNAFLTGISSPAEIKSQIEVTPISQMERFLCELPRRLELVSDCIDQIKLCGQNPAATPQFTGKICGLLNQFALFHVFLHRWLVELRHWTPTGETSDATLQQNTLNSFLNTILSQQKEFRAEMEGDLIRNMLSTEGERQHMQGRISAILEDSMRNIQSLKALLTSDCQENSTFELLHVDACTIDESNSSRPPTDRQNAASIKHLESKPQLHHGAPSKENAKVVATKSKATHAASAPLLTECRSSMITVATADGCNSSTIQTVSGTVECATSPLSSNQWSPQKDLSRRSQSVEVRSQLRTLVTGLSFLQSACESNLQSEFPNSDSALFGIECLLCEFHHEQQGASCEGSSHTVQARLAKTPASNLEKCITDREERRGKPGASRVQKISRLISTIKNLLVATGLTAQQKVRTKLKQSRSSSSREALKQVRKRPPRHRGRKRGSRDLAWKIAALLKDYSGALAVRPPGPDSGPSNQLSTASSDLSQLIINVRALLPSGGGCNSPSSRSNSWRCRHGESHRIQENQSNACSVVVVAAGSDESQQGMDISVSSCEPGGVHDYFPTECTNDAVSSCNSRATWESQSILTSLESDWPSRENGLQLLVDQEQVDSHSRDRLMSAAPSGPAPSATPETTVVGHCAENADHSDENRREETILVEWNADVCSFWQHEAPFVRDVSTGKEDGDEEELQIVASGVRSACSRSNGDVSRVDEQVLVDKSWLVDLGPRVPTIKRLAAALTELEGLLACSKAQDHRNN